MPATVETRATTCFLFSGGQHHRYRITNAIENCGFFVNNKKTQIICGNKKKVVTGLSIGGNSLRLPRSTRRDLLKQAFYIDKVGLVEHCMATDQLDPIFIDRFLGKIKFWIYIELESQDARRCHAVVLNAIDKL